MSGIGPISSMRRYHRPAQRRVLELTVQAREQLSPHFVCITLAGDDVQHLEQSGYDQWGRFFIAGPGQDSIVLPQGDRWMLQNGRTPAALRPRVRSYTIRRFHADARSFDVEVATHEPGPGHKPAPGSAWALNAPLGQTVGFLDEGRQYTAPGDASWQLLVGDESALPAILAILERSDTLPAEVFLEVPTDEDTRPAFPTPPGTTLRWLPRNDPDIRPGTLALQAVKDATLPDGVFYTWTAGESGIPTGIRRHLVNDRGVPRSRIDFIGYWRQGRASLG